MNMPTKDLISKLRSLKIQTGSIACFGCGYEHNCGINGCRSRTAFLVSRKRKGIGRTDLNASGTQ